MACSSGGYFIPPRATDTPPPDIAFLLQPAPTNTPPPENPDPLQANDPPAAETSVPKPTFTPPPVNTTPLLYYTQAADTLQMVAVRFDVTPEEITSPDPIAENALLPPNQLLIIPRRLFNTTASQHIFPDSEVVYSPSAIDFDIHAFVSEAGGQLSTYKEWFKTTQTDTGADIVLRVATENSINPRLLLALLEYQSGWVYGKPADLKATDYPMGKVDLKDKGLYRQLVWAMNQLSIGYYSWREGRLLELRFEDGVTARMAPDLNAGSAALQYYFSQIYTGEEWLQAVDMQTGLPALYERMFGSPWLRAQAVEPLYPPGLVQPPLLLPFETGRVWSYTGGPHGAWEHDGSYAALDFAPSSSEPGCQKSNAWVTATASGLVVRSGNGVVVLDLDGDGFEQTGWVLLYLHVSTEGRAPVGTWVGAGDRLGHPSCEGGQATGTHVHIARKYNGEWIAADGPMPFVLSGWTAHAGELAYKGTLTRDGETVSACTCASFETNILRSEDDPFEAGE
jgi:murein DD-endopeptidase MepM/ murein hydrolase activator NlpD